jgi:hypothetical protein
MPRFYNLISLSIFSTFFSFSFPSSFSSPSFSSPSFSSPSFSFPSFSSPPFSFPSFSSPPFSFPSFSSPSFFSFFFEVFTISLQDIFFRQ